MGLPNNHRTTSKRSTSFGEPITQRGQVDYNSIKHWRFVLFLPFSFALPLFWRGEEKEKGRRGGMEQKVSPFPTVGPWAGDGEQLCTECKIQAFNLTRFVIPDSESPLKLGQSIKKTVWICLRCLQWAGRETPTEQDWKYEWGENEVISCLYISEFRGHNKPVTSYHVIMASPK